MGCYAIYPANVTKSGIVVAKSSSFNFEVVEKRKIFKLETLDDMLSNGSESDVLTFLASKNL